MKIISYISNYAKILAMPKQKLVSVSHCDMPAVVASEVEKIRPQIIKFAKKSKAHIDIFDPKKEIMEEKPEIVKEYLKSCIGIKATGVKRTECGLVNYNSKSGTFQTNFIEELKSVLKNLK